MRNRIGALTLLTLLCASSVAAQQSVQLKPIIPRDGTSTTRQPGAPLTNARIVAMVKAGKPASEIIAAIRASTTKFDLSEEGLLALHHQGVSTQILNVMTLTGLHQSILAAKGGGANADELSPQAYPPKSRSNAAGVANADELSPQPFPPKGTLLVSGEQQTMLGGQAKPLLADGGKSAQPTAVERSATTRMVAPPTTSAAVGSALNGTGMLLLAGGGNSSGAKDNPGTLLPAGGNNSSGSKIGTGTLVLAGGTNPSNSKTVAPLPTSSPVASPGNNSGNTSIPSKGHGRNEYEAITVQRGVTKDTGFGNWANSTNTPAGSPINTSGGALTLASPTTTPAGPLNTSGALTITAGNNPAASREIASPQTIKPVAPPSDQAAAASVAQYQPPSGASPGVIGAQMRNAAALSPALARAACAKDPTPRILGVVNLGEPITFQEGHRYTILGCQFGPRNPNNAVYLRDGSSFTWFLHIVSWRSNSVDVSVQRINVGPQLTNLVLFVLGQNGNTKLDGVNLSDQ